MILKKCRICGKEKPLSDFYKATNRALGVKNECKVCFNEDLRKRYKKDGGMKDRNKHLVSNYGITIDDYFALLEKQGGVCAICGRGPENFEVTDKNGVVKSYSRFLVDHDHKTGTVRGLLCRGCNSGLGHFQDSTDVMFKAISYLKEER